METAKTKKNASMVWKYLGINVVLMILLYIYIVRWFNELRLDGGLYKDA